MTHTSSSAPYLRSLVTHTSSPAPYLRSLVTHTSSSAPYLRSLVSIQSLSQSLAVFGVSLPEVADGPLLDEVLGVLQVTRDVLNQTRALLGLQSLATGGQVSKSNTWENSSLKYIGDLHLGWTRGVTKQRTHIYITHNHQQQNICPW